MSKKSCPSYIVGFYIKRDKTAWLLSIISFLKFYSLFHRFDGIDDAPPRELYHGDVRGEGQSSHSAPSELQCFMSLTVPVLAEADLSNFNLELLSWVPKVLQLEIHHR